MNIGLWILESLRVASSIRLEFGHTYHTLILQKYFKCTLAWRAAGTSLKVECMIRLAVVVVKG